MIKDRDGMADIMQNVLLKDPENHHWKAWRPEKKSSLHKNICGQEASSASKAADEKQQQTEQAVKQGIFNKKMTQNKGK